MIKMRNVLTKSKGGITGVVISLVLLSFNGCTSGQDGTNTLPNSNQITEIITPTDKVNQTEITEVSKVKKVHKKTVKSSDRNKTAKKSDTIDYKGQSYKIIEVDGGDRSGERKNNVAVDVGYGDRVYWGLTNDYGQLVYVLADKVILQDDEKEAVNSDGRYYDDEANVPGTELKNFDQGHVIADSLGGVSNSYNITPQESTLNRVGNQAYMEQVIRDAGGCTNFVATITYPNTDTQIPSHYNYKYVLKGEKVVDDFDNVNPDEVNASLISETPAADDKQTSSQNEEKELAKIDKNGNGKVTIEEAKAAGYSMPIYSDNWLYKYMDDRDGDGAVGE